MWTTVSDCAGRSTMHGLANIVNASRLFKVIWFLFVLLALSLFCFHTSTLVGQYLSEPTAMHTSFSQVEFEWPDTIVCFNVEQLLKDRFLSRRNNWTEYIKKKNISDRLRLLNESALRKVFWSNFQLDLDFSNEIRTPSEITAIQIWSDYYCNRIRPKNTEWPWIRFELTDATNISASPGDESKHPKLNGVPLWKLKFKSNPTNISYSGYDIFFVEKDSVPNFNDEHVKVIGGRSYIITLRMSKKKLVNTKHHPCGKRKKEDYVDILNKYKNVTFTVDPRLCEFDIDQEKSKWFYGCVDYNLAFKSSDAQTPLCANLDYLMNVTGQNVSYVYQILNEELPLPKKQNLPFRSERSKKAGCWKFASCDFIDYNSRPFSGTSTTFDTDRTKVDDASLQGMYAFRYAKQMFNKTQDRINFLKSRYIEVIVQSDFKEGSQILIQELRTYTLNDLLSDSGGILGFYMGVSLLTLCELLDLWMRLVKQKFKKKEASKNVAISLKTEVSAEEAELDADKENSRTTRTEQLILK